MLRNIGNSTAHVNGYFTGRAQPVDRSFYRCMDLTGILRRVERRLEVVGITANAASNAAGKPDAIRNLRRAVKTGDRTGVSTATIAALATVLRTTAEWLLTESGLEDPFAEGDEKDTIPVWGLAGAGGKLLRFHEDTGEIGRIAAPKDRTMHTSAVQISGESLGKVFDGWFAIYDEIREPPTTDLLGHLCVLETSKGQVFIKRLEKGRGSKFTLESNYDPPLYDVAVKWAAPVKNIVPK